MKWECQKCGACCKFAGYFIEGFDRGDKVCKFLTENNICSIYESRPDICSTRPFEISDEQAFNLCDYLRNLIKQRGI